MLISCNFSLGLGSAASTSMSGTCRSVGRWTPAHCCVCRVHKRCMQSCAVGLGLRLHWVNAWAKLSWDGGGGGGGGGGHSHLERVGQWKRWKRYALERLARREKGVLRAAHTYTAIIRECPPPPPPPGARADENGFTTELSVSAAMGGGG